MWSGVETFAGGGNPSVLSVTQDRDKFTGSCTRTWD